MILIPKKCPNSWLKGVSSFHKFKWEQTATLSVAAQVSKTPIPGSPVKSHSETHNLSFKTTQETVPPRLKSWNITVSCQAMDKGSWREWTESYMPGIFVAKIGLFKISSESKMEVYNCSEPHTSPHAARETRKEREKSKLAGLYIKKCSWLPGDESLPGKECFFSSWALLSYRAWELPLLVFKFCLFSNSV